PAPVPSHRVDQLERRGDTMKLREILRKVREGPLPPADNAKSTRSLPGAPSWGQNDTRPGITGPIVRKDQTWTRPQPTTTAVTGIALNPENPTSTTRGPGTSTATQPPFSYAKMGRTTTVTPGFGKLRPSGTGITGQ